MNSNYEASSQLNPTQSTAQSSIDSQSSGEEFVSSETGYTFRQADQLEKVKELTENSEPSEPSGEVLHPANREDYKILFSPDVDPTLAVENMKAAQNWLFEAQLEANVGSSLAEEVHQFEKTWSAMNDTARELHERSVYAELKRMFGNEYERRLTLAQQLVSEIEGKAPGITDYLNTTGAGSNITILATLMNHAAMLEERAQNSEKLRG